METFSVDRVIHPVVEKEENRRVDPPPYIRAENVRKQAKFEASEAPGVVPPLDYTGVKRARWYSSPCGRRVVRSEIARY